MRGELLSGMRTSEINGIWGSLEVRLPQSLKSSDDAHRVIVLYSPWRIRCIAALGSSAYRYKVPDQLWSEIHVLRSGWPHDLRHPFSFEQDRASLYRCTLSEPVVLSSQTGPRIGISSELRTGKESRSRGPILK